jgi:hypothetical protein
MRKKNRIKDGICKSSRERKSNNGENNDNNFLLLQLFPHAGSIFVEGGR